MEGNNNEADKEPKLGCCARCSINMAKLGRFIYNPDTGEVLGRSGISWVKILSFYIGFYAILAAFWATCLVVFLKTLDDKVPTMQKMYSMMKDNPGMNYEPFFVNTSGTLISFTPNNKTTTDTYIRQLTDVYNDNLNKSTNISLSLKECSHADGASPNNGCRFHLEDLGSNCTPSTDFGYTIGKPCVLLRINKVFLWDPNNLTFDHEDRCKNPRLHNVEEECKNHNDFLNLSSTVRSKIQPGFISVSCEGENDGDRDNILGVSFYPEGGFPAYFFPYYNPKPYYMTPLVMAQFDVIPGRVTMILCRVWTRNIIHDRNDLQGSVHFELFVGP